MMQTRIARFLVLTSTIAALLAVEPAAARAHPPETSATQAGLTTGTISGTLESRYTRKYPAVVYLSAAATPPIEAPVTNPTMDQQNLIFTPHVLAAQVGSSIDFPNSDAVRHNVYTTKSSVCQFNLGTYPANTIKTITCSRTGVVTVLCNVHAEMSGYIVFTPTPYFATTDESGSFSIDGVPAGEYELTFWHERLASQSLEVVVEPGAELVVEFTELRRK